MQALDWWNAFIDNDIWIEFRTTGTTGQVKVHDDRSISTWPIDLGPNYLLSLYYTSIMATGFTQPTIGPVVTYTSAMTGTVGHTFSYTVGLNNLSGTMDDGTVQISLKFQYAYNPNLLAGMYYRAGVYRIYNNAV